jgi:AraC-like DNA-binding protein
MSSQADKKHYPKVYLYKRIVQAKLFMDQHFASEIDLDNIADEACFSKFHFLRLFKSVYRRSPHQYLIQVRIENAKRLLEQNHSVKDTCYEVGFDSVTSFSTLFRRLVKQSPSVYQELYFKRQEEMKNAPLNFVPNCFAEKKGFL